MHTRIIIVLISVISTTLFAGVSKTFFPDHPFIHYSGRIDFSDTGKPRLSSAGAYFTFRFIGKSCSVHLEDQNPFGKYNYISIEMDGKYHGRIRLNREQTEYPVADELTDGEHSILICKATESQIGYISLTGITCQEIMPLPPLPERKIEFIGNSITCGMGLDLSEIPCGQKEWFDQHNAYFAFGPVISRELKADWLLSAISGIGVIRTWNRETPSMPQIYEKTFLDGDTSISWNFSKYKPDLICVCLGTNDFSDGDGTYQRLPVDSVKFTMAYIRFIDRLRQNQPQAKMIMMSSPALEKTKNERLIIFLKAIIRHFEQVDSRLPIRLFTFASHYGKGCTGHPNIEEHRQMADELLPFLQSTMNW